MKEFENDPPIFTSIKEFEFGPTTKTKEGLHDHC